MIIDLFDRLKLTTSERKKSTWEYEFDYNLEIELLR